MGLIYKWPSSVEASISVLLLIYNINKYCDDILWLMGIREKKCNLMIIKEQEMKVYWLTKMLLNFHRVIAFRLIGSFIWNISNDNTHNTSFLLNTYVHRYQLYR